ncbi:MAG: hypothetical protein JXR65_03985 [Bacteroidales bacterium]|nr:hypothetical protein [Bacteroidales bacterium]
MKNFKNYYILILTLLFLFSGIKISLAGNQQGGNVTSTTSFTIKTNSVSQLSKINWDHVKHYFDGVSKDQTIEINIVYTSQDPSKDALIGSFSLSSKGKISSINKMIHDISTSIKKMIEFTKKSATAKK